MRHIEVVAGSFAIVEDGKVIGVVAKSVGSETQWGFFPIVPGSGGLNYAALQQALEGGMRFKPD
jgi:hypothetical protein